MPEPAQIWKPMLFSFLLLSKWPFIVLSVNGEINIFQISSKKRFYNNGHTGEIIGINSGIK